MCWALCHSCSFMRNLYPWQAGSCSKCSVTAASAASLQRLFVVSVTFPNFGTSMLDGPLVLQECNQLYAQSTGEGPFYLPEGNLRTDVTEAEPGLPVQLFVNVLDSDCRPIGAAFVDIWHANAEGLYSGFAGMQLCKPRCELPELSFRSGACLFSGATWDLVGRIAVDLLQKVQDAEALKLAEMIQNLHFLPKNCILSHSLCPGKLEHTICKSFCQSFRQGSTAALQARPIVQIWSEIEICSKPNQLQIFHGNRLTHGICTSRHSTWNKDI